MNASLPNPFLTKIWVKPWLLAAMLMAVCGTPSALEHKASWSNALELASLAGIGARLKQSFAVPIEAVLKGHSTRASNCQELLALRTKGYQPKSDQDFALERYEGARCLTLTLLKIARPAQATYLQQFRLDGNAITLLPPTAAASFSTIESDAERLAESQGKSLGDLQTGLKAHQEGDVLVLSNDTWESRIEIYARGDFDGDGVEDLLVAVHELATQGSFDSTKLLLLTRKQPEGRLSTIKQLQ